MEESYRKTKQILENIKKQGKDINEKNIKKINDNYALKLPRQEVNSEMLFSENVKSANINNETNTVKINLYNNYVMAILTDIYTADFQEIKQKLKTEKECLVFNNLAVTEIKNNQLPFIKGLKGEKGNRK